MGNKRCLGNLRLASLKASTSSSPSGRIGHRDRRRGISSASSGSSIKSSSGAETGGIGGDGERISGGGGTDFDLGLELIAGVGVGTSEGVGATPLALPLLLPVPGVALVLPFAPFVGLAPLGFVTSACTVRLCLLRASVRANALLHPIISESQ